MPEVNQYAFNCPEVVEALIKKAGLHEGKWQLIVNFGFGAANMGPTPAQMAPGAAVVISSLALQKATVESPESLTVDAAVVNPASASTKKPQPSAQSPSARRR